jgi:membrane protein YdbS with pleckstrin-like domain
MTAPAPPERPVKDPARARFFAIALVRLSGAVMVLLGLLITERRLDLPWALGVVLTVAGFFDVFVMPKILARRWRSPAA